nr:hypothetical protein [Fodinicola feengrottensis]
MGDSGAALAGMQERKTGHPLSDRIPPGAPRRRAEWTRPVSPNTSSAPLAGASTEYADIRADLAARADDLRGEHARAVEEISELQRDRVSDGAGDDQADAGSKAFEREQELSLARGIQARLDQVERALSGWTPARTASASSAATKSRPPGWRLSRSLRCA